MPSWPVPSDAEVTAALARLAQPLQRSYFFERLDNPRWVKPLHKAHAFANPPDPVSGQDVDHVSFPPWPEGEFLARMAFEAPDDVAAVLKTTETNDNPLVTRVLLEAASALPESHVPQVLPPAARWLRARHADWYSDAAVALIVRAFELRRTRPALKLTGSLLAILPDPRIAEKRLLIDEFGSRPSLQPGARLSDWEYKRALDRIVPAGLPAAGVELVRKLSSLLQHALRHSRWEDEERDPSEYSHIWRPAVEDHVQNHDRDVRDALTSGIRDLAFALIADRPETQDVVLDLLLGGAMLHHRIGLFLLSRTTGGVDRVISDLRDRDFLDDYRLTHEVAQLLDGRWNDIDQATRDSVFAWIDNGDVDRYRELVERTEGAPASDADVQRHKSIWQRDRYSFLVRHLAGEDRERYDALTAIFGESQHADFASWTVTWMGTTGPVAKDDLETWPIERIAEYVRTWEPPGVHTWPPEPTVEGLANTLKDVAVGRAAEISSHALEFAGADPTYIRALFDAFDAALKEHSELDWGPVLSLAASVADRPFEPDTVEPDRDRDPGFRWVRRHVASTIQTGFRDRPNGIAWDLRNEVWRVIEHLTNDPNPTPEHEYRYGGDNMDPFTLSLNTNRATAMHSVVEYGLWCYRHLKALGIHEPLAREQFPEVLRLMDRHLDPATDPSVAVRAVYGRWFAWLVLMDEAWAMSRAPTIFGPRDSSTDLGDVAWDTYIVRTPPYDNVFRVLRPWYERAMAALSDDEPDRIDPMRSPAHRLGEHLTTFSWRGEDDGGLAERFYDQAPDDLAGSVTAFVGRTLSNTTELSPAIAERIQAHWDRRIEELRADPDRHQIELRAFSTWFESGKLDLHWCLKHLEETVRLSGAPRHTTNTLERLAQDDIDPITAVRILAVIVGRPTDPWENVLWREPAKVILRRAIGNPEAHRDIRTVIDYFVRTGDQSFRGFVPRSNSSLDTQSGDPGGAADVPPL